MSKNQKIINTELCIFSNEAKSKHTIKDSVFKDLFSNLENVKKLYLSLHPEDANVSTTEILECTHKSIFVESLLNDLSFIVRDKLMVYAEFVRILHECCQRLGYSRSAVQKAIAICKDRNILKEYLVEREVEVVDIITSLFDQDYVMGVHIEAEKRKVAVAMEEAAKKKQFENVQRMLEDKLPIELIQRYTQLDSKSIIEIASQLGVEI